MNNTDYTTVVELEGCNGEFITVAGPRAGDMGMYLGEDVKGSFYDPPVKVVYEQPGNYPGSRYLSHRILKREITFAIEILNDKKESPIQSWMSRDSFLRKMFAYNKDSKIHVTTPESGTRTLKCRLGDDGFHVEMMFDPDGELINRAVVSVVAGDVFWYEPDVVYTAVTKLDTRFDPSFWTPPWPWEELPKETLTFNVSPYDGKGGLNPTDQEVFLKWILPGAVDPVPGLPWPFPPGIPIPWETAPFTQYTLPDYSFDDDDQATRTVKTPGLIKGEDCVVDTDDRVEQFTSASGSQVWARTNGVRFRNPVPPYTREAILPVDVSGTPVGQLVSLRIPRPWSRPWGLE